MWFFLKEKGIQIPSGRLLQGFGLVGKNRNLAAHGNKAWTIAQCCFKYNSYLAQFELKDIAGCSPLNNGDLSEMEDLRLFCDGSWSRE